MAFIYFILDTLEFIRSQLNSNSGLITAIATVVLVGITWKYVRFTREYVHLTQEYVHLTDSLLKATYKPQIFISLRYEEFIGSSGSSLHWQRIYVKNIGVGPARKVKFGGDISVRIGECPPLKEISFIKNGIDALALGQEKNERAPIEFEPAEAYPPVLITVTYKDSMGCDHDDEFTLDFNDRNDRVESGNS